MLGDHSEKKSAGFKKLSWRARSRLYEGAGIVRNKSSSFFRRAAGRTIAESDWEVHCPIWRRDHQKRAHPENAPVAAETVYGLNQS